MAEPWRVLSQVIDGQRMFIVGRQIDPAQPLHGGNVEYSDGYTADRDAVAKRVEDLNGRGATTVCNCGGSCGLSSIPTCDLVKELAAREGVSQYVAGPQDRYHVKVRTVDAVTTADFDLGPATILVVVD